ncbi:MAG: molybdopterin-dependent oxidoreductase [Betaproteobacteria bacterium]|nr:molybdopterin-dependent oxidoreductase [Betaproteobacteria bacterium]
MTETRSTCPYCGVGCGVIIESQAGTITGVRGDPAHPANAGRLCTKGSTLHLTATPMMQAQARALRPLRRTQRGAPLQPVSWDAALDETAARLASVVQTHGPDAVGLYLSGQLLTEDYYVFNKLGKGLIGTNNVDTNSRLCMSSAVAGYKASLGADAPPACYEDIGLARTLFITGSNAAWAHPVLFRRIEDARRDNPRLRIIVADPRRTETAAQADLHLALLPGTDVVLHHAMLHLMLWEDLIDRAWIAAHTTGFEALRDRVREFTPAHAAKVCGLRADDIVQAARWFAGLDDGAGERSPTLSLYCQGLNQSAAGTDKNTTLINLHLACAQVGRPGAGPFSLTGQPNAMGGREVGGLANLLSAHRDLANPAHRAEVAALWGVREVAARPGRKAVEMFEAAAEGEIRALWIACTNPAQSLPDQALVRRALQRCEFVVLQEAFLGTATADYADLLLPAASWGEKEGTVTNSERRISRVRRAIDPPGEAREDWAIAVAVGRRLERLLPDRRVSGREGQSLFDWEGPEAVWCEHRETTRGRDLDITGLSWTTLAQPQQWPFPTGSREGAARLYTDGRFATPDGRARFTAPAWRPTAEARDARFPVSLTTGRLRDQWHGTSRTALLGRLFAHAPLPCVELHPQELARRRWREGALVRVSSRHGALVLPAQANPAVPPAQAFIAMHWGSETIAGAGVNALTARAVCPQSGQPELKHTAVRLAAAELPWRLVGAAWLPQGQWLAARERLRARLAGLDYASLTPFGREPDDRMGLLWQAAAAEPVDAGIRSEIESALGLDDPQALRYADPRAGQWRAVRFSDQGSLSAFLLAGDARAQDWVLDLLQQDLPAAAFGRALLAASERPPRPVAARSPQVCACHDVSEADIVGALAECEGDPPSQLRELQQRLACGTGCGSCLPALRGLVERHARLGARA